MFEPMISSILILFLVFLIFSFLNLNFEKRLSVLARTLITFFALSFIGILFNYFRIAKVYRSDLFLLIGFTALFYFYFIKSEVPTNDDLSDALSEIARGLADKESQILDLIEEKKQLKDYFYIRIEARDGNVKNEKFQETYKRFYNLHLANLSEDFFDAYFNLLEKQEEELETILNVLAEEGEGSVQFSHATKLMHTLNDDRPIYTTAIKKTFNLNVKRGSKDKKIQSCLQTYQELEEKFEELLDSSTIQKLTEDFRKKFDFKTGGISDVKILSLFIWGYHRLD